jgi:hypothetical protein
MLIAGMFLAAGRAHAWESPVHVPGPAPARIALARDAAAGAYVLTSGLDLTLRLLDATGALGPPLVLGVAGPSRWHVGAVADGLGGAYIWWLEGGQIRLTRVDPAGLVPGWTARGTLVGTQISPYARPWVRPDATGGVRVGFQCYSGAIWIPEESVRALVKLVHFTPGGASRPIHALSGNLVPAESAESWVSTAAFADALDGGTWVLMAVGRIDMARGGIHPGTWNLLRIMADGRRAPGFAPHGNSLAPFPADVGGWEVPTSPHAALIADPWGGVLTLRGNPMWEYPRAVGEVVLERFHADGTADTSGVGPTVVGYSLSGSHLDRDANAIRAGDHGVGFALDGSGAPHMLTQGIFTDAPIFLEIDPIAWDGTRRRGHAHTHSPTARVGPGPGGSLLICHFQPTGPDRISNDAHVAFYCWRGDLRFFEMYYAPYSVAVLDADAVTLSEGSVLLAWSRADGSGGDSTGVWLVRRSVPPLGTASPAMAVRLRVRLEGDRLHASIPRAGAGELSLHDVAGRTLQTIPVPLGATEVTLALERSLPTGLYFARVRRGDGTQEVAKLGVVR